MTVFYFKTLQDLPKLGFFGLKIYHLATLLPSRGSRPGFKRYIRLETKITLKNYKLVSTLYQVRKEKIGSFLIFH
jgi:hypothetical protein